MIIGIDGNEANENIRVGIGQYAFQLLNQIFKIKNHDDRFNIYLKNRNSPELPPQSVNWKYEIIGPKFLWTQMALPLNLFLKDKNDIFFSPTHYSPRFSPCKKAISIMDLSFLYYPAFFKKDDLYKLNKWTRYSVKKASVIFTISKSTKRDIIKNYSVSSDKIHVTYPGYDRNKFKPADNLAKVKKYLSEKFDINGDFILFVGTIQPRKNIGRLIDAYISIKRRIPKTDLVTSGKKGWLYDDILAKAYKYKNDGVKMIDYTTDDDLVKLYQAARCLVIPSLYEGFGIPVIEAFACNCPVVVSNVSSLPEIVGEAGVLIEPLDIKEIGKGMIEAGFNENFRRKLIFSGRQRLKLFSWEKCAEKTYRILKNAAL